MAKGTIKTTGITLLFALAVTGAVNIFNDFIRTPYSKEVVCTSPPLKKCNCHCYYPNSTEGDKDLITSPPAPPLQ
ncbi:MAG: hypothetical protein KAJ86_02780 [Alphaproteobacteria bacterium]|nr:hypothetical protein [Alphaproteobacteria bacterium]